MRICTYKYKFVFMLCIICMRIISCIDMSAQNILYKNQSLYIYNFTKHISWPGESTHNEFKIGVYGNSPLYNELQLMAKIKKAKNVTPIKVEQLRTLDDVGDFQIIYLPSSKSRELKMLIEKIGTKPVLIIAERDGLARKGAIINFIIMENGILRFEINLKQLKEHQLKISPELLKLGFKVG